MTLKDTQYLNRPKKRAMVRVFQAMNSMSPTPETEDVRVCVCQGNRILVNRLVFLCEME